MGTSSVVVDRVPGWAPGLDERFLVDGADGVEARFRAIGAGDELSDLALRRRDGADAEEDPDSPVYGVVRADGRLEIGWSNAAGLCAMLSDYGAHLVEVRAFSLGRLPIRLDMLQRARFAEVRGHLAQRDDAGFRLQPIRAHDPTRIALAELTTQERAVWERLAHRCQCPACARRMWTPDEADALAAELERDAKATMPKVNDCMATTRALVRAAVLAGASPTGVGWRRIRSWRDREAAASFAAELLGHAKMDVWLAAMSACLDAASEAETAVALVERALKDKPKMIAYVLARSHHLAPAARRAVHERLVAEVEGTPRADVREAMMALAGDRLALDPDLRARLEARRG